MKTVARIVLALVVIGAAIWLLTGYLLVRYTCNLLRKPAIAATVRVATRPLAVAAPQARATIEQMLPCMKLSPADVDYFLITAANYRILGRDERAMALYERALQFDKRPEIYFELGRTQLQLGLQREAFQNLLIAGYSGRYVNDLEYPELRNRLITAVAEREAAIRSRLDP